MVKKLLITSPFILLLLMLGLALIPVPAAHADECNAQQCEDPVLTGCAASQFIITSKDFIAQGETWEIRLRGTTSQNSACVHRVWASLVLKSGSNPTLFNSQDIQVYTMFQYDILPSPQFGSGAYTNMLIFSNQFACAQYDGNSLNQPPAACSSTY